MTTLNLKKLGHSLSSARDSLGLSVAQTARRSEMPGHQLHAYERGGVLPRLDTLIRLADALQVDVTGLLGDALEDETGEGD